MGESTRKGWGNRIRDARKLMGSVAGRAWRASVEGRRTAGQATAESARWLGEKSAEQAGRVSDATAEDIHRQVAEDEREILERYPVLVSAIQETRLRS